jgi:hypothetical protein
MDIRLGYESGIKACREIVKALLIQKLLCSPPKFCSGIDTKKLSGYNIKQLGRRNYLFGFTAAASSLGGHLFFSGSDPL